MSSPVVVPFKVCLRSRKPSTNLNAASKAGNSIRDARGASGIFFWSLTVKQRFRYTGISDSLEAIDSMRGLSRVLLVQCSKLRGHAARWVTGTSVTSGRSAEPAAQWRNLLVVTGTPLARFSHRPILCRFREAFRDPAACHPPHVTGT